MRVAPCLTAYLFLLLVTSAGCQKQDSSEPSTPGTPLFREVAEEVGLRFHHFTGATGEFFVPEIVGAGVALFDYDNDGDLDVYLVQGRLLGQDKRMSDARFPPPPGWKPSHRLFRNEVVPTGTLRFTDVTDQAGVGHIGYGMGVAVGDYDNDRDLDLYVTHLGSNVLFRNNGDGTFTDVTRRAGVDDPRWSTSAAFLDYDHDGHLDLFVANYVDFTIKGNKRCYAPSGELDYCLPAIYRPVPDRLFRNLGNGCFADVTRAAGMASAAGPGLGVAGADLNDDGWMDIYVANDGTANHFLLNQGDGTFREVALPSGTAYSGDGQAQAGMGVTMGDFDTDGDEDILVTNITKEGAVLYRNEGRGDFFDTTAEFGLLEPTFRYTGFGVGWFDYDNDGRLDLFIANGAVTIMESLRGSPYPFHQPNQLFHQETDGPTFRKMTALAGPALQLSEVSRGAAFGDIDNDGDTDIVVSNNNGPARLLRNEVGTRRRWLQVRLEAGEGNHFAVGARVALLRKGRKPAWRRVHTDSSYLSASDVRLHFGLGETPAVESVVVCWPDGSKETWQIHQTDTVITLRQGIGTGGGD